MDTRTRTALVVAVVAVVSLLAAGAVEASTYRWNLDGNGSWTIPGNWTLTAGPPNPAGYPNGAGDIAEFINAFSANRTITLTQSITLGSLRITDDNQAFFTATGPGRFVFDSGGPSAASVRTASTGNHQFSLPIVLASHFEVTVGQPSAKVTATMGITELEDPGARTLRKTGPGTFHSYALAPNTFTGTTTVEQGTLELQHLSGALALMGPLVIGLGVSQSVTASVRLLANNQIADGLPVVVRSDGSLSLPESDDVIGPLRVEEGSVTLGLSGASRLTVTAITMTGGSISIASSSTLQLAGNVEATSTATESATIGGFGGYGALSLNGNTRFFTVADGPRAVDLEVAAAIVGSGSFGIVKDGPGAMRFTGTASNMYDGTTNVRGGRLDLARTGAVSIPASMNVGVFGGGSQAEVHLLEDNNIYDGAGVTVFANSAFRVVDAVETFSLLYADGGTVTVSGATGGRLRVESHLKLTGGAMTIEPSSLIIVGNTITGTSTATRTSTIGGGGRLFLEGAGTHGLSVPNGPQPIDLHITAEIAGDANAQIFKAEPGVARFDAANSYPGNTIVSQGTLLINGAQPNSSILLSFTGTLGGSGQVGTIAPSTATEPMIAPGTSPGILTSKSFTGATGMTLFLEVNGTTAGSGYDQLKVAGTVNLANTTLIVDAPPGFVPPALARFIIIDNDGTDPIVGTFASIAEGTNVRVGDEEIMTLSYVGGDGNDVVLISQTPPSYFLAEGATGGFFDDDVLIANPNDASAPVTLTFLQEGGGTVVEHRTVAAQSRVTVHVDQIAGLENASPSVQVTSDDALPLVVERSMFWDASYYGGHTANAVTKPETTWVFAEGFQGFFDTYILIANANAEATTATITFLRENDTPVVKTVPVAAFSRRTVYAGDYSELVGSAFGVVVSATRPVIAERAMYFGSVPGKLWSGGHANTGIAAASTSWFHAEGATGGFFNTFILLSNPQDSAAHVDLRFLLDSVAGGGGEVITRQKTIGAQQRLTVNPATEGDARLENAAVSTIVSSDVPIVSERSMYWQGDAVPFGEGHNSAGVVDTATRWGLAEGRVGGPHQFATFILLANPQTTAAQVTITYLREGGAAPIVKTYTVPATSRFNVDVGSVVPELQNDAVGESFGARIEVTNGVPIAVERSLYWNANGVFWAGGTNALAIALP